MVLPDGTGSESKRPGSGRTTLFVGAALALAAGFVALGTLTSPDPLAIEASSSTTPSTSTTVGEVAPPIDLDNFSVSQIATGEALVWEQTATFDSLFPLTILEHDGAVYLFATSAPVWNEGSRGLWVWKSPDGATWQRFGQVIDDEASVVAVTTTPDGFIASGTRGDGPGFVVWNLTESMDWTETAIPVETESPYMEVFPRVVGGNDDVTVVTAEVHFDSSRLIRDRLRSQGVEIDLSGIELGTEWRGEEGHVLTIYGPMGMPLKTIPIDDLELSDQERQWITNGFEPADYARIWTKQGPRDWQPGVVEGVQWVNSIVGRADGRLLMLGFGVTGPTGRVSQDGLLWQPLSSPGAPTRAELWGDLLVGVKDSSRPDVVTSQDGRTWDDTDLTEMFPSSLSWWPQTIAAGDEGIALTVTASLPTARSAPQPIEIAKTEDGVTLTFDPNRGVYEVTADGATYSWETYSTTGSEGLDDLDVDLATEVITFMSPVTGEPLISTTFDELNNRVQSFWVEEYESEEHHAFVFTPDGSEWTIQDVSVDFGDGAQIWMLEIAQGRVVAVVSQTANYYSYSPVPGFEVWSAPIP